MASRTSPPNNTLLYGALAMGAAFLYMRGKQGQRTNSLYGSPNATPMSPAYMASPSAGGYGWSRTQNQSVMGQRGGAYGPAYGAYPAQPDNYTNAGRLIGSALSRWLSPNTDAPYGATVPDSTASGYSPSLSDSYMPPAYLSDFQTGDVYDY